MIRIDKDSLIEEANYIEDSLSALQTFMDYRLNTKLSINDINEIVSLVTAIKLLAKKHIEDNVDWEFETKYSKLSL